MMPPTQKRLMELRDEADGWARDYAAANLRDQADAWERIGLAIAECVESTRGDFVLITKTINNRMSNIVFGEDWQRRSRS